MFASSSDTASQSACGSIPGSVAEPLPEEYADTHAEPLTVSKSDREHVCVEQPHAQRDAVHLSLVDALAEPQSPSQTQTQPTSLPLGDADYDEIAERDAQWQRQS